MARPKKDINPTQVRRLAEIACTNEEIAAVLGCSADTLTRRYAEVMEKGRQQCRCTLRRLQWKQAQKGHPTMLIWLGKQLLGQRDRQEVEVTKLPEIRVVCEP